MSTHAHAPLVVDTAQEAAETMVSEGSPPHSGNGFDPQIVTQRFPRWHIADDGLVAEFDFPTYLSAIEFVRQVAEIAECMNHHPEIWIGWRKVRLAIMTHSKNAITRIDGTFVERVEQLF